VADAPSRPLRCRTYESAWAIDPEEFFKADWACDTWSLAFRSEEGACADATHAFTMVAHLLPDARGRETIYRDVQLAVGDYAVFARVHQTNDVQNRYRANARFTAILPDQETAIGVVEGNDPAGSSGWVWRDVGPFHTDGQPFRLAVSAHNDDGLAEAWFNLGPVIFVERENHSVPENVPGKQVDIAATPAATQSFEGSSQVAPGHTRRTDIEVYDPARRQYRHIWFHAVGK